MPASQVPAARAAVVAYIGVGANLGDARASVRAAIAEIAALPEVAASRAASLYLTAPIDSDGPHYVNTVLRVETTLPALALLDALQAIEQAHGRTRPYRNAPRTLDLDLLLYGAGRIDTPRLQVPHPRMLARAFVLAPLVELEPDLHVQGVPAREALAQCQQEITRIPNNL